MANDSVWWSVVRYTGCPRRIVHLIINLIVIPDPVQVLCQHRAHIGLGAVRGTALREADGASTQQRMVHGALDRMRRLCVHLLVEAPAGTKISGCGDKRSGEHEYWIAEGDMCLFVCSQTRMTVC